MNQQIRGRLPKENAAMNRSRSGRTGETTTRARRWLLFALIIPCAAWSDLSVWLDAIDDTNPTVSAAHARWKAAEAMTGQVSAWPDPMAGVKMERNSTSLDDYMALEYMLEQEIPWTGRLRVDREVAHLLAEAEGFEYLEVRRAIRADITAATWALWQAREQVEIARELVVLTESLSETARAGVEAGQLPQVSWLRLRVETERLRNEAVTMEREVAVALARLNGLLDEPPTTPRDTSVMPPLPTLDVSVEQLQQEARHYRFVLMAMVWREMAADLARKSAKLEQRPMFSVQVMARQFRETGSIDEIDTGVVMSLPWVWRGKYRGMRAEAEAEYQMANAKLAGEVAMTLTEIQEFYTEAESRLRTLALYEDVLLPETRALADSAREAYPAGTITAMELIDALRMVQDAEQTIRQEKAAYATAYAKLMAVAQPWTPDEVATGLPLHMEEDL